MMKILNLISLSTNCLLKHRLGDFYANLAVTTWKIPISVRILKSAPPNTVICYTPDSNVLFFFSFFVFDCSIIVTTVQYLSSALHKNFTETDFDFKVRTDAQKMLWHLFKLAVTKEQKLFSTLADYICSIYLSICEEDDLTDKRQEFESAVELRGSRTDTVRSNQENWGPHKGNEYLHKQWS